MYGKLFATAYTGSMFGAGSHVFAVWGYILANKDVDQLVELNPHLLAAVFGESTERVVAAIEYLSAPDERSRSEGESGRRIVPAGQSMMYFVVNGEKYDKIRNTDERRRQNREAQQRFRSAHPSKPAVSKRKHTVSKGEHPSAPSAPVAVAVEVSVATKQTVAPKKPGARVSGYTPLFEETWKRFWLAGPLRKDNLNKLEAWTQWASWLAGRSIRHMAGKQFATEQEMADGTAAYASVVEQENPESRYIKSPERFYGQGRHFSAQYQPVAHEPSEDELLRRATPEQRRHIARIEANIAEQAAEEERGRQIDEARAAR